VKPSIPKRSAIAIEVVAHVIALLVRIEAGAHADGRRHRRHAAAQRIDRHRIELGLYGLDSSGVHVELNALGCRGERLHALEVFHREVEHALLLRAGALQRRHLVRSGAARHQHAEDAPVFDGASERQRIEARSSMAAQPQNGSAKCAQISSVIPPRRRSDSVHI
jgi:hypothetical protein